MCLTQDPTIAHPYHDAPKQICLEGTNIYRMNPAYAGKRFDDYHQSHYHYYCLDCCCYDAGPAVSLAPLVIASGGVSVPVAVLCLTSTLSLQAFCYAGFHAYVQVTLPLLRTQEMRKKEREHCAVTLEASVCRSSPQWRFQHVLVSCHLICWSMSSSVTERCSQISVDGRGQQVWMWGHCLVMMATLSSRCLVRGQGGGGGSYF